MEVNAVSGSMAEKAEADRKEFSDSKLHRAITAALVNMEHEDGTETAMGSIGKKKSDEE